jgi:predicted ATPase/DNA-binding SARP family transcriptional activator
MGCRGGLGGAGANEVTATLAPSSRLGHSARVDRGQLPLCVDVLGPLVLRVHGHEVQVPGKRRRALLALLALEGERGISVDRLVDALWPDGPPDNATQALYSHVSRLRTHLGELSDRLERRPNGYRLRLAPHELDADAVQRLATSDVPAALDLWRGPALAEFAAVQELDAAAVGLEELRLQLVDDLLDTRLAAGEAGVVVATAEAAAAAPLRERTALLHVRALAAAGRSAEAMEAARAFRRRLADETGLDPSPALTELEQLVASGRVASGWVGRPVYARVSRPDAPMVGRQHDREEVLRLLGINGVVTVTGPGGVGKTRLALDIAADWADSPAVVVPLGAVARADRVEAAVASHLGLRLDGPPGPDDVAAALADRDLLLVLDNCEHLVEACRSLAVAIRRRAAGVRVLATSRVTLQVPGEYVVRLQPLPVPRDSGDIESLRRQPGVRAFVEHARRRSATFELDPGDAADLVEVLHRLDGLPLGIELAARQVAVMPLSAVRQRLDRALDLATGRQGPEDARQRTLRASIASSYELLGEPARRLLRLLGAFPGGVDVATVEALADGLGEPIDLLHDLVDSSLLVADAAQGRYRVLFIVRAFLSDLVTELGEAEQVRGRFVRRCVVVAEELCAASYTADEPEADRRMRAELDNLRAARDLARDHGDVGSLVAVTLLAGQMGTWRDLREIWSWLTQLADDPAVSDRPERVLVTSLAADAARLAGDFDTAERLADRAVALADETTEPADLAMAWSARAAVAHFAGDFAEAIALWLRAAEPPGRESGSFTCSAALAATYGGDVETARTLLDRATALMTGVGSPSQHAFLAYVEGEWRSPLGVEDPTPYYRRAIDLASRTGAHFVEGVARVSLAASQRRAGDLTSAAAGYAEMLRGWRRTGHRTQLWTTARNAAELLAAAGVVEVGALLLAAAEAAPGVAVVGPEIARYSHRVNVRLSDLVEPARVDAVRAEAAALGAAAVLDLAESGLRDVAGDDRRAEDRH